jgi:hypothetical protein
MGTARSYGPDVSIRIRTPQQPGPG